MSKRALREDWLDWRYGGERGSTWWLVNDPAVTFDSEEAAMAYCDEHNRALAGKAAIRERERIVAWLKNHKGFGAAWFGQAIENGEHYREDSPC